MYIKSIYNIIRLIFIIFPLKLTIEKYISKRTKIFDKVRGKKSRTVEILVAEDRFVTTQWKEVNNSDVRAGMEFRGVTSDRAIPKILFYGR